MEEILQSVIDLAEEGFPVAPIAAHMWEQGSRELLDPSNAHGGDMLLEGKPPKAGEIMKMPHLAATFRVGFFFCVCVSSYFYGSPLINSPKL